MTKAKTKVSFFTIGHQTLLWWGICTNLSGEAAAAYANRVSPPGTKAGWVLSHDSFPDGRKNPHDCPDNPGNRHYLLNC